MASREAWTIDPSGTSLSLNSSSIKIRDPGFTVQGPIKASMAETIDGEGSPTLSAQYENWTISGSLVVSNEGSVTVEDSLDKLGNVGDRVMREGRDLKRVLSTAQGGSTIFYDLESFEIDPGIVKADLVRASEVEVGVTMTAKPLARMAESTLADKTETSLPCLTFTYSSIQGQAPALGRLIIDNDSTAYHWNFIAGGIQSRYYSTADTAALYYQAEHLTPLGSAATSASTSLWSEGSFTGGFVKSTNLGPIWTGILENLISTAALASTTPSYMTNVGTFRAWARVFQPSGNSTGVQVRLDWSPGDDRELTENDPVYVTVKNDAQLCDLGLIQIPEALAGSNRWVGRINAKSAVTGDDIYVDDLRLLPVDEGYFEVRTPFSLDTPTVFSARSEFATESGAITGDSLAIGGTWVAAGSTGDYTEANDVATRTRVSEAGSIKDGRLVTASTPTTLTDTLAKVDFKFSVNNLLNQQGLIFRYTDINNFLAVVLNIRNPGFLLVQKVTGGLVSTILQGPTNISTTTDTYYTIWALVNSYGTVKVWLELQGQSPTVPDLVTSDPALITGGTLASGSVGIIDHQISATANTRTYDNFAAWVPETAYATPHEQSMQWRHDGALREDEDGEVWVPAPLDGDPLLVPPAGREARTLRGIIMPSRGDPRSGESDSGIDDISARLRVQPRIYTIPG